MGWLLTERIGGCLFERVRKKVLVGTVAALLGFVVACSLNPFSSGTGNIEGVVRADDNNEPVFGATVLTDPAIVLTTTVSSDTTKTVSSGTTDSLGIFMIGAVPVGDYQVHVFHTTYEPQVSMVTVKGGKTVNPLILMKRLPQ